MEDNYIDMKEELNLANVDYAGFGEKVAKMRD